MIFNVKLTLDLNDEENELLPEFTDKDDEIMDVSGETRFVFPFGDVKTGDNIEIECTYIESLMLFEGYYYLRIPLTFLDAETSLSMFQPAEMSMGSTKHKDPKISKKLNDMDEKELVPDKSVGIGDENGNFEDKVSVVCYFHHGISMNTVVKQFI